MDKKPYAIEFKNIDPNLWPDSKQIWNKWNKYKTERDRREALIGLRRSHEKMYEFRKKA